MICTVLEMVCDISLPLERHWLHLERHWLPWLPWLPWECNMLLWELPALSWERHWLPSAFAVGDTDADCLHSDHNDYACAQSHYLNPLEPLWRPVT
jgi:hypothetical protein